jgi:hypothetical protein
MHKPKTRPLENPLVGCYNSNIPQEKRRFASGAKYGQRSPARAGWRLRMRATSTVVVFSSLLVAASVAAGPSATADNKKTPPAAKGSAAAKASAGSGGAAAGAAGTGSAGAMTAPDPTPPAPPVDVATVKPEDMPTAVRMRRLEQQTEALKERAWQLKARVQMLKEQVIGGGAGAQAIVAHANEMGASFRMIKLIYSLDGTQVFVRTDDTAESLYKTRSFDVFSGPISPGNHELGAIATYRGHGYGVFEYLSKYTFTAKSGQAFLAGQGKISRVDCRGFEKGGATTPLEKRAAIECKVTQVAPDKPSDEPAAAPGTAPASPAAPAPAAPTSAPAPAGTPPAPGAAKPGK